MKNGDKPAYAHCMVDPSSGACLIEPGMTKREAFAMAAMQGLCSNPYYAQCQRDIAIKSEGDYCIDPVLAERAIQIADELLKQLES